MIWINGQAAHTLAVNDRGLQYGDGVWETLAIRNGQLMQQEAHLQRLCKGVQALAIQGFDVAVLRQELAAFMSSQRLPRKAVLKIIVTRGQGGRGYSPHGCEQPTRILSLHPWPDYPAHYARDGIRLASCQTRLSRNPQLAGFKHLNRLEQVLARAELPASCQEGLVRDTQGHIIEGTMSNLFLILPDNQVVTPELSACGIAGIARSCILDILCSMQVETRISTVDSATLEQAQGLFVCNSVIRIWPVRQWQLENGRQRDYTIPALTRKLQENLKERL